MENLFKSEQRIIKDYTTINYKGEESDHGTYAMVEIPVNYKKNLLFSLHVKTVFYKDNEVLDYLYTKDYPEDCEIYISEGTTKIKTLYHREENDIFNIQECDKTNNAIKRILNDKNQNILISSNKKLYVEVNTYKVKASQYNHLNNEYNKKKLSQRWNYFKYNNEDIKIQRDLYSAYLIKNVDGLEAINRNNCIDGFENFLEYHNNEISRLQGLKNLSSIGI